MEGRGGCGSKPLCGSTEWERRAREEGADERDHSKRYPPPLKRQWARESGRLPTRKIGSDKKTEQGKYSGLVSWKKVRKSP